MPIADIKSDYRQHPFDMRVRFCHVNGTFSYQNFKYIFIGGLKPDIDEEVFEFTKLPVTGWKISASSANFDSPADNLLDANTNSLWHSKWSSGNDPLPYLINLDLGSLKNVNGIALVARQDRSDGRPKDIKIELSPDGSNWGAASEWQLKDTGSRQTRRFNGVQNIRYLRIKIENVYAGSIVNPQYSHLAELELF